MLKPTFGLALLLTTLVALGPLSTDLYLPALPALTRDFSTEVAQVQLTLSVFLAGFALAQLAYGPLSDRFGRRPILLAGLVIYLGASVACMFAPSIETLIAARFVQALGACAGPVLGRAVVRDVYGPSQAARVLAYISGAMALAPMLGPVLGGWLTVWFGWRANFAALAIFSALQCVATALLLGESNAHKDPEATRLARMAQNFSSLMAAREYRGYLLCFSFAYAGLFAFISGSSFVLINLHGLSPQWYGASFGFVVAGYITGTLVSGRFTLRLGTRRMVLLGGVFAIGSGWVMAGLSLAGALSVWALLLPMFAYMVATGIVMPNAIGGALAPYPRMAGAASALLGFVQMSVAAAVGIIVGHSYNQTALPMALAIAVCGSLVLLCYGLWVREGAKQRGT